MFSKDITDGHGDEEIMAIYKFLLPQY